jgi:hypothetical protein
MKSRVLSAVVAAAFASQGASGAGDIVRGADELFWVPTLEQALEAAAVTGKPVFVMGYSLVDERSTFTKLGPEFPRCVF